MLSLGKAVAIEEEGSEVFHSERQDFNRPVIIRLLIAIAHRVYRTLRIRFNKRNVLARDSWTCQYCGSTHRTLTIDHVLAAEEMFLTASCAGVRPVVRVERHAVANEEPGCVTRKIMAAYGELVAAECGT